MNKIEQYIELKKNFEENIILSKTTLEDATFGINIMHESNYVVDENTFNCFVQQYYVVMGIICKYYNGANGLLKDLMQDQDKDYVDVDIAKNINDIREDFNDKQKLCERELEYLRELVANFSNNYRIEKRPILDTCDSQKTFLDEYLNRVREIGRQENKIDGILYSMEMLLDKKNTCLSRDFIENVTINKNEDPEM